MQSFEQIQSQIGAWSLENFGHQETPYLEVMGAGTISGKEPRKPGDKPDFTEHWAPGPLVVQLNELAPLMGLAEEVGELATALEECDGKAIDDALGDITIYLCDYCCRSGVTVPVEGRRRNRPDQDDPMRGVSAALGRLFRAHLKRHQRIRGFHDVAVFREEEDRALRHLVWHLNAFADQNTHTNLLTILNTTWNNIVKKRDWRKDAAKGGDHSHKEA